jgi:hypothetical protein
VDVVDGGGTAFSAAAVVAAAGGVFVVGVLGVRRWVFSVECGVGGPPGPPILGGDRRSGGEGVFFLELAFEVLLDLGEADLEGFRADGLEAELEDPAGGLDLGVRVVRVLHDGAEDLDGAVGGLLEAAGGLFPLVRAGVQEGGAEGGVPQPAAEGALAGAGLLCGFGLGVAGEEGEDGEALGVRESLGLGGGAEGWGVREHGSLLSGVQWSGFRVQWPR